MVRFSAVMVCLLAASALPASDLIRLLRGVENRYNRARTLEVQFEHSYRGQGRAWRPERGRLLLRKPGKMRWEYSVPPGKLFVSDGRFVYLYSPLSNEVERMPLKQSEDLRAPLAFLLGRLDFQAHFKRFTVRPQGADRWITAEPRSDRLAYSQVEFLVDPDHRIKCVRVTGQDRSLMEFRFDHEKLNPALEDDLFVFSMPPGARLVSSSQ